MGGQLNTGSDFNLFMLERGIFDCSGGDVCLLLLSSALCYILQTFSLCITLPHPLHYLILTPALFATYYCLLYLLILALLLLTFEIWIIHY